MLVCTFGGNRSEDRHLQWFSWCLAMLFPLANRPVLILWVFEASNLRSFMLELCTNESGL